MSKAMTSDARKKDTREKIELGGLIVKAGLRYEKRALLLGC
ncbi:conjugal transfer protein TraD [Agrobacterium tumefaciens]|nr:conjugal transfer protein TraD [Agrobacterium tumefaciens]